MTTSIPDAAASPMSRPPLPVTIVGVTASGSMAWAPRSASRPAPPSSLVMTVATRGGRPVPPPSRGPGGLKPAWYPFIAVNARPGGTEAVSACCRH